MAVPSDKLFESVFLRLIHQSRFVTRADPACRSVTGVNFYEKQGPEMTGIPHIPSEVPVHPRYDLRGSAGLGGPRPYKGPGRGHEQRRIDAMSGDFANNRLQLFS